MTLGDIITLIFLVTVISSIPIYIVAQFTLDEYDISVSNIIKKTKALLKRPTPLQK